MNRIKRSKTNGEIKKPLDPATRHPPCTVVICARNEASNLAQYLPAVLEQEYPNTFEVLVVDDASVDDTPNILKRFQEKYAQLRVLRIAKKDNPGKKNALSAGVLAAHFDSLVFTDADCQPSSPLWLSKMMETLWAKNETEIVLGYGPMKPEPGYLNGWVRYETLITAIQYFSFAKAGIAYMGVGRNLAWKRQVFERVDGFKSHQDLASGDDDLFINAAANPQNVAVCMAPDAFMYSEGKSTWKEWFRQKSRHLSTGTRYRLVHTLLLGVISLTHVLHYFLLVLLLCFSVHLGLILLLYLLRIISMQLIFRKWLATLGASDLLSWIPVYDALFAFYYGVIVPINLFRKQEINTWK